MCIIIFAGISLLIYGIITNNWLPVIIGLVFFLGMGLIMSIRDSNRNDDR